MMKRLLLYIYIIVPVAMLSCSDDDSFSSDSIYRLSFSADTVSLDTVFSTVPTSTYSFSVYNRSKKGLHISKIRLKRGNQTGYRVNVDGVYLDNASGSQAYDFDIRKEDSLRVFVELTPSLNNADVPKLVSDDIVFTLESGVEQSVNLRAYSWDAQMFDSLIISNDSVIETDKPLLVYKGIKIDSMATLRINYPTKIYFHSGAGIDVYGKLIISGQPMQGGDVVLRGDRTDRMFSYLPYDRISGQWRGIHIYPSSSGNIISGADIHSSEYGVICDSAAYNSDETRLTVHHSTIHNCKGPGIQAFNSFVYISDSQISNTLGDCLAVYGGRTEVVFSTLAQFYPFSADRGMALNFADHYEDNPYPTDAFICYNTLVTGYAKDVINGSLRDTVNVASYAFVNSIIRTPEIKDTVEIKHFVNCIFETPEDSVQGKDHFISIDESNMLYDFRLQEKSPARGKAYLFPGEYTVDRYYRLRGEFPDIGCFQYNEEDANKP